MCKGIYDHCKVKDRPFGYTLPRVFRVCSYEKCGIIFEVIVTSKKKYCSRKCANRNAGENRPKEFYKNRVSLKGKKRPSFSDEWKRNMSKAAKGKRSGSKNSNWKGGVTGEHQLIRCSDAHKIWSRSVFERDNFTCQYCDKRDGKRLAAHHIKSFANYPEDRLNVDNGVTLHNGCHVHLHNMIRQGSSDAKIIKIQSRRNAK